MYFIQFINDACVHLPPDYGLLVSFVSGEMSVELTGPYGETLDFDPPEKCGDVGYCQHAINFARRHAGLSDFYHADLIDNTVLNQPSP